MGSDQRKLLLSQDFPFRCARNRALVRHFQCGKWRSKSPNSTRDGRRRPLEHAFFLSFIERRRALNYTGWTVKTTVFPFVSRSSRHAPANQLGQSPGELLMSRILKHTRIE